MAGAGAGVTARGRGPANGGADLPRDLVAELLPGVSWRGLAAVVQGSPAMIGVWAGAELRLALANRAAAPLLGSIPLGTHAQDAYPGFPEHTAALHHVRCSGETLVRRDAPATITPEGRTPVRAVDVTFAPLRDDAGAVVAVVTQAVDVTSRFAQDEDVRTALALDRAGQELSRSLEVDLVTSTVTRLAADVFAGWAILDLLRADGTLARVAVTHHDPTLQEAVQVLRRVPRISGRPTGHPESNAERTVRTGEATSGRYDLDALVASATSVEHARVVRALRPEWFVCVPVQVGARRLGALTVLRRQGGAPFSRSDRATLAQFAERAAIALAHASDYDEQRQAALTLQRHLLPSRPRRDAGLEVAVRYAPGGSGAEVGGDWYDVIELDGGWLGVVVGDVEGHDLAAAALMGQVRAVVHSHARAGSPPSQVVAHANTFVHRATADRLVTMDYLQVNPAQGLLVSVRAGHVPALVVPPSGRPWTLAARGGLPLGVAAEDSWHEQTVHAPPGSLVLVTTDGLVERVGRDAEQGLDALAEHLAGLVGSDLDVLADEVLQRMAAPAAHDDIAFVLMRLPAAVDVPRREASRRMPAAPWAAPLLRQHARDLLGHWGVGEDVVEVAALLLTELVSNATRHSDQPVELRLSEPEGGRLRVGVFDDSHRQPQLLDAGDDATSGRGLHLVQALAATWGVQPEERGKTVWFELDVPPDVLAPDGSAGGATVRA